MKACICFGKIWKDTHETDGLWEVGLEFGGGGEGGVYLSLSTTL